MKLNSKLYNKYANVENSSKSFQLVIQPSEKISPNIYEEENANKIVTKTEYLGFHNPREVLMK